MLTIEFILMLLACVLLSAIVEQFLPKVAAPLIQVAFGVLIYFLVQGNFELVFQGDLFLVLFVAPLLYNESKNISKTILVKNRIAILSAAIGLVLIMSLIVGFTLNAIIPSIPLAAAFAVGAALGPTDSVAVTSLPDEVRIGNRQKGILKGECLFNDASAIVAFEFAIAAVTTLSFSVVDATSTFLFLFIGGIIFGIIFGFIIYGIKWAIQKSGLDNITFHVLLDLFLPFVVYLAAEVFNVSGILSVVALGITNSILDDRPRHNILTPANSRLNIVSSSVWQVFVFSLNGIVFVLLGAILPKTLIACWIDPAYDNVWLITYVVLMTILMYGVRFIWFFCSENLHLKISKQAKNMKNSLQNALIMTVGGAKGAVTMAIVFTIPVMLNDQTPFPGRIVLFFVAGGVVLTSILITNFVLPLLVPKHEKKKQAQIESFNQDTEIEVIDILRSVIERLSGLIDNENRFAVQNVIASYSDRIEGLKNNNDIEQNLDVDARKFAFQLEEDFVFDQLKQGNVKPNIAYKYLRRLSSKVSLLEHNKSVLWRVRNFIAKTVSFFRTLPTKTKNFAKKNKLEIGESQKFATKELKVLKDPINNYLDLQIATINHVIKNLDTQIANIDINPEIISFILDEYRSHLRNINVKSPSITTINKMNDTTNEYTLMALNFETEEIYKRYEDKKITREQFKKMMAKVMLMRVSIEEF